MTQCSVLKTIRFQRQRPPGLPRRCESCGVELGAYPCYTALVLGSIDRLQSRSDVVQQAFGGPKHSRRRLGLLLLAGDDCQANQRQSDITLLPKLPEDRQALVEQPARFCDIAGAQRYTTKL